MHLSRTWGSLRRIRIRADAILLTYRARYDCPALEAERAGSLSDIILLMAWSMLGNAKRGQDQPGITSSASRGEMKGCQDPRPADWESFEKELDEVQLSCAQHYYYS